MSDLRIAMVIAVFAAGMALSVVVALRHRIGAVLLAILSLLWILVDQPFEGAVLIKVTASNGLTSGDLVGVFGLIVAAWLWVRPPRR